MPVSDCRATTSLNIVHRLAGPTLLDFANEHTDPDLQRGVAHCPEARIDTSQDSAAMR
jgi:hypothetical protein